MAHGRFEIRIEHLDLELPTAPGGASAGRALVEAALKRLGERLASSPFHARAPIGPIAIERLTLGAMTMDELLGPRGAERIADELYAELTRRLG